jgi:hypothetical protein
MTIQQAGTTNLLYDNSTYHIFDTPHTTRLIETFIGEERRVGEVRGWRRNLLNLVDKHYQKQDNRERGYRLYLATKVLNGLRLPGKSTRYLELMKQLTLEEVIFWVWQYNSYGKKAITAFKTIHIHNR